MRQFVIVLLIIGLTGTVWADDEPEDDSPAAGAVEAYVTALFSNDYEGAQAVLCAADLETLDQSAFEQTLEPVITHRYMTDLSELTYDTLDLGETLAEVSVKGTIDVEIDDQVQAVSLKSLGLGLDRLWVVYEEKSWKACSQVPPDLIDDLEPDVIARVFINATYEGNYEQAHGLMCDALSMVLSEEQFDQIYDAFLEQDLWLNFHDTTFEITERTDERATVTLMGDIMMTIEERPSPIAVSAEEIGLSPVYLRYEDSWKICSAEPVES